MAGSARGKVILFGEHAVVHGRLAVAAALDRGARAVAEAIDGPSRLSIATWGKDVRVGDDDEIARAFGAIIETLAASSPRAVTVEVSIPGGAGLGCSAALGVAIARAIDPHAGDAIIDAAAMAWERVFHGNPSGVDVAVASRGGIVAFRKGDPPRPVFPPEPIEIAVASTGEASSTRAMVEQVARQLARRPQVVERTFDGIDTLAKKGVGSIETARWYELGQLMDLNHALLASLMLSTERLEAACNVARRAGAMGAKLTGGGGGGCAIALAPGKSREVVEAWRGIGMEGFVAKLAPFVPIAKGTS